MRQKMLEVLCQWLKVLAEAQGGNGKVFLGGEQVVLRIQGKVDVLI